MKWNHWRIDLQHSATAAASEDDDEDGDDE